MGGTTPSWLPPDPGLPGSAALTDRAALADLLGVDPRSARVRVRQYDHRPGEELTVGVTVDGRRAAVSIGVVAGIGHGAHVVWFPDDTGLPGCRAGWPALSRAVGVDIDPLDCDVLAWVPHRRLVLGAGDVVVKLHADPAETAQAIECARLARTVVAVPGVIADAASLAVHVQERVAGRALGRADAEAAVGDACAVLDRLRRLDPARLRPHPPAALLVQCEPVVGLVDFALPELAGRTSRLLAALEERCPVGLPAVAGHGDFNVGQLLAGDGGLVLVDTDTLCAAPPAYDPASYAANVVSGRAGDLEAGRELLERLRDAGGPDVRDGLDWYFAAMVVRRLDRAIRRGKTAWRERTERLVASAEHLLA